MSSAEQNHVAILVASVVGYDRLRKVNAVGAGDQLDRALRTVARIGSDRGGRLFSGGDDAALEFILSDPVDAVEAAIEIQEALAKHNAELSAGEQLDARIGIAFGEGFVEGQRLGGDAPLVARGLARRARPGSTFVSKEVFRRIQPYLHFSYRRRDRQAIAGVAHPAEAYQIKRAPPDGKRAIRRRWVKRMRRAWARRGRRARAAVARPALTVRKGAAVACMALAVLVIGTITYKHWTVGSKGMVGTATSEASLAVGDQAPTGPRSTTTMVGPNAPGPNGITDRPQTSIQPGNTVIKDFSRGAPDLDTGTAAPPAAEQQHPRTAVATAPPEAGEPTSVAPPPPADVAPSEIGSEATIATEPSPAKPATEIADRGSLSAPAPAPTPVAKEGQAAESATTASPRADKGYSVTGALAALWARLFPEPESQAVKPAATPRPASEMAAAEEHQSTTWEGTKIAEAPAASEGATAGEHRPETDHEIKTARLVDGGRPEAPLVDKRSIVVLPFANPSGDPARAYFGDGVAQTLTNSLTRFPHLKVIASSSTAGYHDPPVDPARIGKELGVRYILDGTATRTSDDLVITAQLIDTSTGNQVWKPVFNGHSSDPSAVEQTLIQWVLFTLDGRDPKSVPSDRFGFEPVGTVSLEAYDYALQWRSLFNKSTKADNLRAREAAVRASELDAGYATAYAFVAWTYMADYWRGWTNDPKETVRRALQWATRGLDQDARDYNVQWAIGDIYQTLGEYDKAVAAYETALAINPEAADLLEEFGTWMLPLRGRAQEGVALAEKAMLLNPHHPDSYYGDIAFNYYLLGAYDKAIRSVERVAQPRLDHRLYLAASYAQANRPEKAKFEIAKVLEGHENLTVEEFLTTYPFKDETDREHLRIGLQEAGLPIRRIN